MSRSPRQPAHVRPRPPIGRRVAVRAGRVHYADLGSAAVHGPGGNRLPSGLAEAGQAGSLSHVGPRSGPHVPAPGSPLPAPRSPGGFTLIELLIAISIIGILAGAAIFALAGAQESARETKTRSTIAKLHGLTMDRWETYRVRRLPIELPPHPSKADEARLRALRELMRMEMPDRWTDITDNPIILPFRPALSLAYLRRYQSVQAEKGAEFPTAQFQGAECLYLIVTMGPADEVGGIEQFRASEIGDADGDGMPEFLDGWGRPISFLRWAPGFTRAPTGQPLSELQSGDPAKDPDPFDPRRLDKSSFVLFPLVYSAGPDGRYGIKSDGPDGSGGNLSYARNQNNPYVNLPDGKIGVPIDETSGERGGSDYVDNLHNHLLLVQ